MEDIFAQLIIFSKILLAAILGGAIGYERELKDKPAGLRTHMLVAAASSAIMLIGGNILIGYHDNDQIIADPIRIIQAIILGIGFIGGGLVTTEGGEVKNLTTAASILFIAIVGISVALDQFIIALLLTALSLFINSSLYRLENRIHDKRNEH